MTWKSPVIMIGLDAATWTVIDPLLASGRLPNIARLMREGTSGRLQSLPNYPSPALWTSITTGKLPEKHGVLGFYSATRFNIRCPTLYEILEGNSGNVGLWRWYATWPPVQNAGFTVPSSIARSPETHPAKLKFINDLVRAADFRAYLRGGLQLMQHSARLSTLAKCIAEQLYETITRPERREWLYRRRQIETVIHTDVFVHLLRGYRPRFAAILYPIIDEASHAYWKYREPELFDAVTMAEVRKYGHVIDAAYIAVDKALGIILQAIPKDALVIVLSDHGQQAGPSLIQPYLISQKLIKLLGFQDRVWMTNIGYITLLRPQSTPDSHETLAELKEALGQIELWQDKRTVFQISTEGNTQLVVQVGLDPDADLDSAVSLPGGLTVQLSDIVFARRVSGTHTPLGILIMRGPGVRKEHKIEGASILDIAPTVLALRDRPVSQDMDGQVIVDAIQGGFLEQNPVCYIESYETEKPTREETPFTDEELEELESRLRALGYLS